MIRKVFVPRGIRGGNSCKEMDPTTLFVRKSVLFLSVVFIIFRSNPSAKRLSMLGKSAPIRPGRSISDICVLLCFA